MELRELTMKKLILLLLLIPSLLFAQEWQEARMGAGMMGGGVPIAACPVGTYMFYYNGDYPDDTDKACFTNGTVTKDGTISGATVTSDYVLIEAANQYIQWVIASEDGISDSEGTVFATICMIDDGDADVETTQIWESYIDTNNYMLCQIDGGTNKLVCYHRGNGGTAQTVLSSSTFDSFCDTWYRVGYTWQTGADAGGKHSVSLVLLGNDPVWTEAVEDLDDWATPPDKFTIGENLTSGGVVDDMRVKDVIILQGYQTDDPLQ